MCQLSCTELCFVVLLLTDSLPCRVLLGSGKSTAYLEAIKFVLGPYTEEREKQGSRVVLLPVSLPTLHDPLGGIFKEGHFYLTNCFHTVLA